MSEEIKKSTPKRTSKKSEPVVQAAETFTEPETKTTVTEVSYEWTPWGTREMNDMIEQNTKAWLNYWTGVMNGFWGTGKK